MSRSLKKGPFVDTSLLEKVEENAHQLHEERRRREKTGDRKPAPDEGDNGPKAAVAKKTRPRTKTRA